MSGPPGRGYLLGPAPCHRCHARLYYQWRRGWVERHLVATATGGEEVRWRDHTCTALSPFPGNGQYVGACSPRLAGKQVRAGAEYRVLLGHTDAKGVALGRRTG